jgi:hypothetical protein
MRPIGEADFPVVAELVRRAEAAWFGAPEQDENEVAERLRLAGPLSARSRLVEEDGRVVGAAWAGPAGTELTVDPDGNAALVLAELVPWLEGIGAGPLAALDRDEQLIESLERRGWRYDHSSFELIRAVEAGWDLPAPQWPAGGTVR